MAAGGRFEAGIEGRCDKSGEGAAFGWDAHVAAGEAGQPVPRQLLQVITASNEVPGPCPGTPAIVRVDATIVWAVAPDKKHAGRAE
jgi:hypothetical protein